MLIFLNNLKVFIYKNAFFFIGLKGIINLYVPYIILNLNINIFNNYIKFSPSNNLKFSLNVQNYIFIQFIKVILNLNNFFRKKIVFFGIGFRCWLCNYKAFNYIILKIGSSRDICVKIPFDINVVSVKPTILLLESFNKNKVYQFVSFLRSLKKLNIYKGKGIRYYNESFTLKQGKHN